MESCRCAEIAKLGQAGSLSTPFLQLGPGYLKVGPGGAEFLCHGWTSLTLIGASKNGDDKFGCVLLVANVSVAPSLPI